MYRLLAKAVRWATDKRDEAGEEVELAGVEEPYQSKAAPKKFRTLTGPLQLLQVNHLFLLSSINYIFVECMDTNMLFT